METPIVAISIKSLFLAEHKISGCSNCTDRVSIRFERVLDAITERPAATKYVLPTLAICPMCHHHVDESTMVQLRKDAHELIFINRADLKKSTRKRKIARSRREQ